MTDVARADEIEALLRAEPALPGVQAAFASGRLVALLGWDLTADHVAALGRIERAAGRGSPRLWLLKLAVLAGSLPPAELYDRFAAIGLHTEAKRVADLLLTAGRLPAPGDVAGQAQFLRMRTPAAVADALLLEVALTGRAGPDVQALAGLAGLSAAVDGWEARLRAQGDAVIPASFAGPREEPPARAPGLPTAGYQARGTRPGGGELLALVVGALLLAGMAFGGWALFSRTAGDGPRVANDLYARASTGASARIETAAGLAVVVTLSEPWDARDPDVHVRIDGGGYGSDRPGIWTFVLDDGSVLVPARAPSATAEVRLRLPSPLPDGTAVVEVRFEPEDRSGSVTFYLDPAGE